MAERDPKNGLPASVYQPMSLKVDDKSERDIITYIDHPDFCGSGGCSIDIYKFDSSGQSKDIGAFFSTGEVAFAGTVTNAYRDLINDKADFIVFDGTQTQKSRLGEEKLYVTMEPSQTNKGYWL
jgi:hypothetical protein